MEVILEHSFDGFVKVIIPSLHITTWAKPDEEDIEIAISEALELHKQIPL